MFMTKREDAGNCRIIGYKLDLRSRQRPELRSRGYSHLSPQGLLQARCGHYTDIVEVLQICGDFQYL